jgi:hypothetical protein
VTEPITYIFDPRDPTLTTEQLQQYKSQNWDIFSVPDTLITEFKRLGILLPEDNVNNLVISLSYGGVDPTEFYEAIHNRDRHRFFKTTEKQGINHTLYRIVNGQLEFVHHLQISIPNDIVRFTGCYIDQLYNGKLYAITTNAYPKNILDKKIVNETGQIPHQEIVLARLNTLNGQYEDTIIIKLLNCLILIVIILKLIWNGEIPALTIPRWILWILFFVPEMYLVNLV